MGSTEMDNKKEEEWEETYLVAELRGIHEPKGIVEEIEKGHSKVVSVGTEKPAVVVGNHLFLGKWREPFGSHMIFEKNDNEVESCVRFLGCSDRKLIADKATMPHSPEELGPARKATTNCPVELLEGDKEHPTSRSLFQWFDEYFSHGCTSSSELPICYFTSNLQKETPSFVPRCLFTLQKNVEIGTRVSYGELGRLVGSANAARAVGTAMRSNPVPIIIPCHRVVKSDGSLGNYCSGKLNHIKEWLLEFEQNIGA